MTERVTVVTVEVAPSVMSAAPASRRIPDMMGARQKLNDQYATGSLIIAIIGGLTTGSWSAFLATLVVLIGMGYVGGDIRPSDRGR